MTITLIPLRQEGIDEPARPGPKRICQEPRNAAGSSNYGGSSGTDAGVGGQRPSEPSSGDSSEPPQQHSLLTTTSSEALRTGTATGARRRSRRDSVDTVLGSVNAGVASPRLRRAASLPRNQRASRVGEPSSLRHMPFVRVKASRGANSHAWAYDIHAAPLQAKVCTPLLAMIDTAMAAMPKDLVPLGSFVEAALRTHDHAKPDADSSGGGSSSAPLRGRVAHGLGRSAGCTSPINAPCHVRWYERHRASGAGARFSIACRPFASHCTTRATLRAATLPSFSLTAYRSMGCPWRMPPSRVGCDSVSIRSPQIQPEGANKPIALIPPTRLIKGTVAKLVVHSPGFENPKSLTKFRFHS